MTTSNPSCERRYRCDGRRGTGGRVAIDGYRRRRHGGTVAKLLVLVRHAKSSWADPDLADHDRPLNGRGRRAATVVGHHLRDTGRVPDLVLCSSAIRARQTLERFGLPSATDVSIEDPLYGADASELLTRLQAVPAAVGSVLVLGHNPGVEDLVGLLVDDRHTVPERFPTAAVAELRLPIGTWEELMPQIGRLHSFVIPRELE
jgi:phosphohistidine phosphatase